MIFLEWSDSAIKSMAKVGRFRFNLDLDILGSGLVYIHESVGRPNKFYNPENIKSDDLLIFGLLQWLRTHQVSEWQRICLKKEKKLFGWQSIGCLPSPGNLPCAILLAITYVRL